MSQWKSVILNALGWQGHDLHTIVINMLDRCMSAKVLGLPAVMTEHFLRDGRTKNLDTGEAAVSLSPAYKRTFRSAAHALVRLVQKERGNLDLLARGDSVKTPAEMAALVEARRSGGAAS